MLYCDHMALLRRAAVEFAVAVISAGSVGATGASVSAGLVVVPLMTLYTLAIIKTPIIFSDQPWKLRPLKRGMSETERVVDLLLMEDIVDRVCWFLKRKELGCVSEQV